MRISPYAYPGTFRKIPSRPEPQPTISLYAMPMDIVQLVCKWYDTTYTAACIKTRRREVVRVRQVAWYFIDRYSHDITLKAAASCFGDFDHTTVMHGIESVKDKIETDDEFKADIKALALTLQPIRNFHH